MNIDEAKELLAASLLTADDLDAILAAEREADCLAVRESCTSCSGSGYARPDDPTCQDECEYCGRPIVAIRGRKP